VIGFHVFHPCFEVSGFPFHTATIQNCSEIKYFFVPVYVPIIAGMIHMSLFSGIGGFELAAEWAGWQNVMSCEINTFGHKVLSHYWPEAYHHNDVHTLNYELINEELTKRFGAEWQSEDVILSGGFPCQPYSVAGKRLGKNDTRHLWPEMLRIISEVKPTWVVGENVRGLISWNGGMVFNEVQSDLEAIGYEVLPFILPACAVNAPHRRDRVWFVAYAKGHGNRGGLQRLESEDGGIGESKECRENNNELGNNGEKRPPQNPNNIGCVQREPDEERTADGQQRHVGAGNPVGVCGEQMAGVIADTNGIGFTGKEHGQAKPGKHSQFSPIPNWHNFPTQSPVRSRNDGISTELAGITFSKHRNESIKAYGNAVVPQVVYQIFQAINHFHELDHHNRRR
jgi:DNA (cytosine-5)-methyltransferase 1